MDVRVLEAGQQQPSGEIDHLGARPGQLAQLLAADGGDTAPGDGDGGRGTGLGRLGGEDGAAGEQQISVHDAFPGRCQWEVVSSSGASASVPAPVRKYGDLRTHLAYAATANPDTIIATGMSSRNQPLSACGSRWSAEA